MGNPTFTFCVPNLNKVDFLPACIESILKQDCSDWCCVFVDGYSTDGSWEYMQQFSDDPRFKLLRGLRKGMYADWNECLTHVETEYFYFLTSDDTCFPTLVSATTSQLDQYPDVDACHFQFAYIDVQGTMTRSPQDIIQHQFPLYADINQIPHRRSGLCEFVMHYAYRAPYVTITSLVFRRCLIEKLEGFRLNYGSSGDYDWTMRLCLATDILYLPKLLATWRIYDGQATTGGRSPQVAKRGLEIASHNLSEFLERNTHHSTVHQALTPSQLLAHLAYEYDFRLYKDSLKEKNVKKIVVLIAQLFSKYPRLFATHLWSRLLKSKEFNIHQSRTSFAQRLIRDHQLQWPPTAIPSQYLDVIKTKAPNPVSPAVQAAQDLEGYV
ncbi:MAG: glycosyltransferase [Cyanobacteria bacterium P01_A01_bin.37]